MMLEETSAFLAGFVEYLNSDAKLCDPLLAKVTPFYNGKGLWDANLWSATTDPATPVS
jgi:hypothetical protein